MWFRSIFLKTVRDYRVAILGWGLGIGALTPIVFLSISKILANSPEVRNELLILARNPVLRLFAEPIDIVHPGGYATFRLSLVLPLVSIWALLAMSRTLRGEEERAVLDILLSTPRSRLRIAIEKAAAVATALLLIGSQIGILAYLGGKLANVELSLRHALLFGLNIALIALIYGALALLISQFTRERRPAAGITAVILGLSFLLTSAGRTLPNREWIGWFSPLYYFELNKPLIAGYAVNVPAMLTLTTLSLILIAVGLSLFLHRDVGAPFIRFEARRVPPTVAWAPRSVFASSVRSVAAPALWWAVSMATYGALITAVLRKAQQNFAGLLEGFAKSAPMYANVISRFLSGSDVDNNARLLNMIFILLCVVTSVFALTQANRWAADEEDGRFELLLSTPQARSKVILSRFAAVSVALIAISTLILIGVALSAWTVSMQLDTNRLAEAAFGIVPVGLVVAGFGYLLAGWLRAALVTGVLTGFLFASFLVTLLGQIFRWPRTLMEFSIFEQYGAPLVDGLQPSNMVALIAVTIATLSVATIRFCRKDLAR